ncbi:hypothetical protein DMW05_06710 [Vibrio parahaemolyticus]|nr:hypothetical protein [Vibrio parahaemolyticus]EGR2930374.1 hypothetical protein [Vibrio parahaemolyticus]EGR2956469.1 hypothetical protein [Vibrio parahaemolyticus]EGR2959796.1 hypothetical protein [Vibrio parahaemolyticus]EGR2964309.1 hypothetical protein [Vibrio parahaemolyticus]
MRLHMISSDLLNLCCFVYKKKGKNNEKNRYCSGYCTCWWCDI